MKSKVALFSEVRENFSEGLRFYMSLQEAISHLAQQVGDYSMTRQIQRYAAGTACTAQHARNGCLLVCLCVGLNFAGARGVDTPPQSAMGGVWQDILFEGMQNPSSFLKPATSHPHVYP